MNVVEASGDREMLAANSALCADDDCIRAKILTLRGVQVILDRDIAILYGVETKVLNQAVKRNRERFPDRFMFQLAGGDIADLRSQIVTSNAQTSLRSQIVTINSRKYCAVTKMDSMFIPSIMQRI